MTNNTMDSIVLRFLELVQETREKKKLTREELARRAGVHKTTIGLLERKMRIPTIQIANQIAVGLDTTLSSMLKKAEKQ